MCRRVAIAAIASVVATTAAAHRPGESYVYFFVAETGVRGQFHIALTDLERVVPLDENGDGAVDDAEIEAGASEIRRALTESLTLYDGDVAHAPAAGRISTLEERPRLQVVLDFDLPDLSAPPPAAIDLDWRLIYPDVDPEHRLLALFASNTRLALTENEARAALTFAPGAERQMLRLGRAPALQMAFALFLVGALHMLSSPGRLALVAALALPAGMRRAAGGWSLRSYGGVRAATYAALGMAAAFGLGLAAAVAAVQTGLPALTPQAHVAALVLAVAVAATDNLRPLASLPRWVVAAVAGLLAGVGATALDEALGVERWFFWPGIVSFGLGVLAAAFLTALIVIAALGAVAASDGVRRLALRVGSVAVLAAAIGWALWRTGMV